MAGAGDVAATKHPSAASASASSSAAPGICLFLGSSFPTLDGSDERTAQQAAQTTQIPSPHHIARTGPVPGGAWDVGACSLTPQNSDSRGKERRKRKTGNFLCGVTRVPTAVCRKTFWEAVTVTQTGPGGLCRKMDCKAGVPSLLTLGVHQSRVSAVPQRARGGEQSLLDAHVSAAPGTLRTGCFLHRINKDVWPDPWRGERVEANRNLSL